MSQHGATHDHTGQRPVAPADERMQFPRMAISDLVVLTLSVGFAFACVAPNYQEALSRGDVTALAVAPDLVEYLADGLLLFGLIVLARQRVRGSNCPLSPGQWIIVACGPYAVLGLAGFLFRPFLGAYLPDRRPMVQAGDDAVFVVVLVLSVIATIPALRLVERRWAICLSLICLWLIAGALWCALDGINAVGLLRRVYWQHHATPLFMSLQMLACTAVVAAVVIDTLQATRYDWLHYIGAATMPLGVVSALANWGWTTARWWRELFLHLLP